MSSERYYLRVSGEWKPLHPSFAPDASSPTRRSPNLVRARNYRRQFDLADGLPDTGVVTFTGSVGDRDFRSEAERSLAERELRRQLRAADAYSRDLRKDPILIQGASFLSIPLDRGNSVTATWQITLIPINVPDEEDDSEFDH